MKAWHSKSTIWYGETNRQRVGTRSSIWARPPVFLSFFFCLIFSSFSPTDRPTFKRERALWNETFYSDGLSLVRAPDISKKAKYNMYQAHKSSKILLWAQKVPVILHLSRLSCFKKYLMENVKNTISEPLDFKIVPRPSYKLAPQEFVFKPPSPTFKIRSAFRLPTWCRG